MAKGILSNFERFDRDGLELVVDTATGKAYASKRAAARMLGIDEKTVRNKTADCDNVIKAEIKTVSGFKTADLLPANVVLKLAMAYKPELAEAMGTAGANVYMLGLAGYSIEVKEPKPKTALELAREQVALLEKIERLEIEKEMLEEENEQLAEAVDELFNYSSIIRIAKFNNCSEKDFNWRTLKMASRLANSEIKQVPCPRFGVKNLYSHDAWRLAYPGVELPETTVLRLPEARPGDE